MYDLIIRGAQVVDGTGAPSRREDVAVRGDRIAEVGRLEGAEARSLVDATDYVVAPGFIDIHSHTDFSLLGDPLLSCKLQQGVTMEVVGNCGFSPAPTAADTRALYMQFTGFLGSLREMPWDRFGAFLDALDGSGLGLNVASLVGHNTLRTAVMGHADRPPNADEMGLMREMLARSMEEGAFGLSTGLIYTPGSFAATEEIVDLARVAAKRGGYYFSHIRGETSRLLDSIGEAVQIGREAALPVQIAHVKAGGKANWNLFPKALELLDRAHREGLDVTCDAYPYTAGSTTLTALLPAWSLEGGIAAMLARLRDPATRRRIAEALTQGEEGSENLVFSGGWEALIISFCPPDPSLEGKSIAELAEMRGLPPVEAFLEFVEEVKGRAAMILHLMSEENVRKALLYPSTMIGSDGFTVGGGGGEGGRPHPRLYGTFPRILGKYVREEKLLSLEEAVRKMTSMPAQRLGLEGRGQVARGMCADLVVFDPQRVGDRATFDLPQQAPEGIVHVFVNGSRAVEHGRPTGRAAGRVLRHQRR